MPEESIALAVTMLYNPSYHQKTDAVKEGCNRSAVDEVQLMSTVEKPEAKRAARVLTQAPKDQAYPRGWSKEEIDKGNGD